MEHLNIICCLRFTLSSCPWGKEEIYLFNPQPCLSKPERKFLIRITLIRFKNDPESNPTLRGEGGLYKHLNCIKN